MRLLVIHNPTSGSRSGNQKIVRELRTFLDAKDISHDILSTTSGKNAEKLLMDRADFDQLVIVGGDGTINETVNGLSVEVPVSIIPAGTGNDFLKNVPIKKSLSEQLEQILTGEDWRVDLGECNGRKFVNGIGIGFDGQIVHDMNGKKIPLLKGHAKYYYHVLTILASYRDRPFSYSIDGVQDAGNFILMTVGNGTTFGGGFKLMPDAKIDDGLLEICSVGPISAFRRFLNIGRLSGGTHGVLIEVTFAKATSVIIEDNELLYAHADGEDIGQPPFEIGILPAALTLRI